MRDMNRRPFYLLLTGILLCLTPQVSYAQKTSSADLDRAIQTADFSGCLQDLSAYLNASVPQTFTIGSLRTLLNSRPFITALDQRLIISKIGLNPLNAFSREGPDQRALLGWLLHNPDAMELCLEGAAPIGVRADEQDTYTLPASALEIWSRILKADGESKSGLCLKLAIATAIAPPGSGSPGAGQPQTRVDPVERYLYFKAAQRKGELFPSFDHLSVWEYEKVVSSGASDKDLTWARELINTWRPDLRIDEQVVKSTSEVWRRSSPHRYSDYPSVLSGGGKCGPRSSWAVMVCQAFGIPAIGVAQPAHACVAFKCCDPSLQPQPGSAWKVAYGRGWTVSRLDGLSGPEFLAGVAARSNADVFSQTLHLRGLAQALTSPRKAAAVIDAMGQIQSSDELSTASAVSAPRQAAALATPAKAPTPATRTAPTILATSASKAHPAVAAAISLGSRPIRISAADCSRVAGVRLLNCFTGGRQANFDKNAKGQWIEYSLDVATAGVYVLQLTAATPNDDQLLNITAGGSHPIAMKIPNTSGLWGQTGDMKITLAPGRQTLRISAPFQRGVAVRWLMIRGAAN